MAWTPKVWVDRAVEFAGRRILTPTGNANEYDVTRSEGTVFVVGDEPDATNLNVEFGHVKTELDAINTNLTANSNSFIFAYDSASASYGYKAGGADTFHPFNKIALAFKNFTVTNWNNGNGVLATVIPTVGIKKALVTLSGWGTGGCGGTLLITGSGVKSYTMLNAPSNGGTGIWSVELDGSVNAITINGVYYNQVNAYDGKLLDIC